MKNADIESREKVVCNDANNESGSAVIIVLAMLAVMTLLVLHLTTLSETLANETKVRVECSKLKYVAESAANRAYWMLLCDRRLVRNRSLLSNVESATALLPFDLEERWMMDGVRHAIEHEDGTAQVVLNDANTGLDVSGATPWLEIEKYLRRMNQDDALPMVDDPANVFLDVLKDYVDGGDGDATRLNGMEQGDYAALGYPNMPRNGPLEFKEEIFWLPGIVEILPSSAGGGDQHPSFGLDEFFRIIPPEFASFPKSGKVDFLSSSDTFIQIAGGFDETEITEILNAKSAWLQNDQLAFDSLSPELANRIRQNFSLSESGIVKISALAMSDAGADSNVTRRLTLTRDCRRITTRAASHEVLLNWQKLLP